MAVAYVQSAGQAPTTSGTVAFTLSSAPTVGNLLVAFCTYSQFGGARTITTPTGWTKFDDFTVVNDSLACFWHVVVGGDSTGYSFTISNSGDNTSGSIYEVSGASKIGPINQFSHTTPPSGNINSITTASVTPSIVGTLALAIVGGDSNATTFSSVTTGWTEQQTQQGNYHPSWSASKNALTTDVSTAISATFTMASSPSGDQGLTEIVLISPATIPPYIKTGSFTGTGASLAITGLGFKPELVMVKVPGSPYDTWFRTQDMTGDYALPVRADGGNSTNRIPSLDTDGFTVGTDAAVNALGSLVVWLAIKDNGANILETFTYTGDGVDGKSISLPWVPDYVLIKSNYGITGAESFLGAGQGTPGSTFSATNAYSSMQYDGGGARSDLIQAQPGVGLFVGNGSTSGGNLVNQNTYAHYGFGLKIRGGVISVFGYTGNATNNYAPFNTGFTPIFLNTAGDGSGAYPQQVYSPMTSGNSVAWDQAQATGAINSLTSTGFTLGTSANTNASGTHYWGLALAASAGTVAPTSSGKFFAFF